MQKYSKIFSDGSLIFHFNTGVKNKKFQILEKDHKNFFLNKKNKNLNNKSSDVSSRYKNKYLF